MREYHSEIAGEVRENLCWIIISDIPDHVGTSENTFPETLSVFSESSQFPSALLYFPKTIPFSKQITSREKKICEYFDLFLHRKEILCLPVILQKRTDQETVKSNRRYTHNRKRITENQMRIRILRTWSRHKLCHHVHLTTHTSTPSC